MYKEEVQELIDRVEKLTKWVTKYRSQYRCASDLALAYSKYYRTRDTASFDNLKIAVEKCEAFIKANSKTT